jgi:hypothetical protein
MRGVPDRWSDRVRPGAEPQAKDREETCEEDDGSPWDRGSLEPCDVGTAHTDGSADRLLAQTRTLASGAQLIRQHHQQVAAPVSSAVGSAMSGGPSSLSRVRSVSTTEVPTGPGSLLLPGHSSPHGFESANEAESRAPSVTLSRAARSILTCGVRCRDSGLLTGDRELGHGAWRSARPA